MIYKEFKGLLDAITTTEIFDYNVRVKDGKTNAIVIDYSNKEFTIIGTTPKLGDNK